MALSKVVVVRAKGVLAQGGDIDRKKLDGLYARGIQVLSGQQNPVDVFTLLFEKNDRVGIKINTIAGRMLSTRPDVSFALANLLEKSGISQRNITIWDRTNRELKDAGYSLSLNQGGLKVFGTDTDGVGYSAELVSHLNIGSLFSLIQSKMITASISLAILKDHGMAGVTAGMKNYFGAIHNPINIMTLTVIHS